MDEWRGLIKAQQESVRMPSFDPLVIRDIYKRGQEAGNEPRMVIQVGD